MKTFFFTLALVLTAGAVLAENPPGTPLPPTQPMPQPAQNNAPAKPQQPPKKEGREDGPGKKPPFLPGKSEMEMRDKLETLSNLSPQQLDAELQKWPRYQQMDLGERAKLLQRIQEFKERRHKMADGKAHELGLNLNPDQFAAFEKKFSEKRMQADRQLWQEMEPRRKALEQQINNELKQEFASQSQPGPSATPPPAPMMPPPAN